MTIFNNNVMLNGYVNHVGMYDGGAFKTLFIRLSVVAYVREGVPQYDTVLAQITRSDEDNTTSSQLKSVMNNQLFDRLNDNLVKGMRVSIQGSLKGYDQIYINGKWQNIKDLSVEDKEHYLSLDNKITRTQSYVYIKEASVPNKENFLEKQKDVLVQSEELEEKVQEPEQADSIETDDNDPVDNDGVVVEHVEVTSINNVNNVKKNGYKPFDEVYSQAQDLEDNLLF